MPISQVINEGAVSHESVDEHSSRLNKKLASDRELVEYLEGVSGKVFYSRQDLSDYVTDLREGGVRKKKDRKLGRQGVWLIVMIVVFLQYVFVDILLEANTLRTTSSLTPTARPAGYRL